MKRLAATLLVAACALVAWQAWQPPYTAEKNAPVRSAIPQNEQIQPQMWRVMTQRMVWKQAVDAMQERLLAAGLELAVVRRKEPVELHAFDDAATFETSQAAEKARAVWQERGIQADVSKLEQGYGVSLGRFYLIDYAERMQARLKEIGAPYQYARRTVTIPAYRFVSAAMEKAETEKLWQTLQDMGIGNPVLIPDSRYLALYGQEPAL